MKIYGAICNVMADVGAIGKEKKNVAQGFAYRGIDDVMNVVQPILVKHKVFLVPEVIRHEREERTNKNGTTLIYSVVTMQYTFYADDGSSVQAIVIGEGMDSGDKATNKAMSIAMKYCLFQVLCIPTEEMKDPDADSHQVQSKDDAKSVIEQHKAQTSQQDKIKKLMAMAKEAGYSEEAVKKHLKEKLNVESRNDLTDEQFEFFFTAYQKVIDTKKKGAAK